MKYVDQTTKIIRMTLFIFCFFCFFFVFFGVILKISLSGSFLTSLSPSLTFFLSFQQLLVQLNDKLAEILQAANEQKRRLDHIDEVVDILSSLGVVFSKTCVYVEEGFFFFFF